MKLHIKVWASNLSECETFVLPCHEDTKTETVERFVEFMETQFPGNTFRTIAVGKNRYNLVPQPVANA